MVVLFGIVAAVVLPFFNIPLILRIRRRKSSQDVSLVWAWGVFVCILLMFPSALRSRDIVFKMFSIVNFLFFSAVVYYVAKYRK